MHYKSSPFLTSDGVQWFCRLNARLKYERSPEPASETIALMLNA
jgi:hypothetical protein